MTSERFLTLLLALRSRETTTTADLAAHAGVSVRTVLRALQGLHGEHPAGVWTAEAAAAAASE